ncbi:uncharacterized protein LOC132739842 isoform X2 [Ruditapes philippinarum]|uniref:uncharacterized protein LOC132739842 isoform X2 n=1 Tax=Ruditapes philippinarum TaxID=129788 RepID=UPI00295A6B2E|nr:uncharacterized protein LOC132739842 isoform X2 [Ruditapes philippinarum]
MSASMVTMAYVRPGILLRGLKHQFSCLSIRGFQHSSTQECTTTQTPLLPCRPHLVHQDTKFDPSLSRAPLNSQKTHKYRFLNRSVTDTIVDNIQRVPVYDCPKITNQNKEISVPSLIIKIPSLPIGDPETTPTEMETPGINPVEKLAHRDRMRIRRRKMKKHQRQRRKARIWPILRKQRYQKSLKKKAKFEKELATLRGYGTNFDAYAEIKENLRKARRMGYSFDIFGEKSKTFGFLDDMKQSK